MRDVLAKHEVRLRQQDAVLVTSWVTRGLSARQVENACLKAKALRQKQGNAAPVYVGYIDAILRDARAERRTTASAQKQSQAGRKSGKTPPSGIHGWRESSASIRAMARELQMGEKLVADATSKSGYRLETLDELADRIEQALRERGEHGRPGP